MSKIHTIHFIDIEDFYGRVERSIELSSPIEIDSKDINVPLFSYAGIDVDGDYNILRIQFDGEENGYYDFDDIEDNALAISNFINEKTDENSSDNDVYQDVYDSLTEIMR